MRGCRTTRRQRLACRGVGGKAGSTTPNSKQPNSFVYRLEPTDRTDLTKGGRLQVLQVIDGNGSPIVFSSPANDADILGQDIADLHTYGKTFTTRWVTIHDTRRRQHAVRRERAAKAAGGTAFKRPENGCSHRTAASATSTSPRPVTPMPTPRQAPRTAVSARSCSCPRTPTDTGHLTMLFRGDVAHTGLDNISFVGRRPTRRGRGRRRRPAHPTQRARLGLPVRHHASTTRTGAQPTGCSPRAAMPRPPSTRRADAACRQRRRQRDHRHPHLER